MNCFLSFTAVAMVISTPLFAQSTPGDVAKGEALFGRQCVVCHVIKDADGTIIAGSNAGSGPNLYGVVGAVAGSVEGYAYSASLTRYGESGAVWDEDNFVAFLQDPTGHLRDALDDPRARSKMSYKLRGNEEAQDILAYLAQFTAEDAPSDDTDSAAATDATPLAEETAVAFDIEAGEDLYQTGCRNCHGPAAKGMASFPKLAGRDFAYIATKLEQYKAGEVVGPNSALMMPVAADLSQTDIANVAGYVATTFQ